MAHGASSFRLCESLSLALYIGQLGCPVSYRSVAASETTARPPGRAGKTLYIVVSSWLELFSIAEGGHEFCTQSPRKEHGNSEHAGPPSGPGLPRGSPILPRCRARRGSDSTASTGLAALAGLRVSGCGVAVAAAGDLAHTDRSRVGRIFSL
jgi:hypothetical protein